jgi:hypothetical protein
VWIGRVFPVKHFANAMQSAFLGAPFRWSDVAVVAIWGIGAIVVASAFFRWEPRH